MLPLSIVVALIWANTPFAASNTGLWETELGFRLGNIKLSESLLHWINDGLMAIFFLSVGLEMKREAPWYASYQHSNRQRSRWLLPAGACSYPQVSTSSSLHGRLALRFQCSELFLKHVGNDGTLTQQAACSVLLYSVVDNSAVQAHVDDLVGQITRIIADGIASGEFMVADLVTAGKAVLHATTRLHNPARAQEWSDPTPTSMHPSSASGLFSCMGLGCANLEWKCRVMWPIDPEGFTTASSLVARRGRQPGYDPSCVAYVNYCSRILLPSSRLRSVFRRSL